MLNKVIDIQADIDKEISDNIRRKGSFVDAVHHHNGVPLFSWIDINPTELCNRTCVFCPRHDPSYYPNQNIHIPLVLIEKIAQELKELEYQGGVIFCGHGEPLLHPNIVDLVGAFGPKIQTEMVTNGDPVNVSLLKELFGAGLGYLLISLYDGEEQVSEMTEMLELAGVSRDRYLLRRRWYTEENDYGLKLTNRAGTVDAGKQKSVDEHRPCFYTHYSMQVDWNGDVLVCVQDWNKRVRFGNLNYDSLVNVWTSKQMDRFRRLLGEGKRRMEPCRNCNVTGTLHGKNHFKEWSKPK
jgi:radical SAM protein with 4Fe4S-binding SPASM domain